LSLKNLMIGSSLIALATPAFAQEAPAADVAAAAEAVDGMDEIVVTAQKSSEKLTKAPIAVSVVSQDSLDRQGLSSADALVTTAPTLQLSQNGFAIRGLGSNNSFSGYSTVATQIDGIYDPSSQVLALGLFDISAVEVLRGPQGTVYGRNATAGVVNINTADPKNVLGMDADFQLGSRNSLRVRAAVDLPVTDTLAIRVAGFHQVDDGLDPQLGAQQAFGKTDLSGARVTAKWQPTSRLTWRLSLNYGENRGTVPLAYLRSYNYYPNANLTYTGPDLKNNLFGPGVTVYDKQINPGVDRVTENRMDVTYYAARSRLAWDVTDTLTATYLAGYSVLKDNGINAATGVFDQRGVKARTETWSHELDLNYTLGRLSLVAGAYVYEDNQPSGARLIHAGNTAPFPFNTVFNAFGAKVVGTGNGISTIDAVDVVNYSAQVGSRSQALFGQAKYEVVDGIRVTGGIRSTWDQVFSRNTQLVCAGGTVTLANMSATTCPTGAAGTLAFTDDRNRDAAKFSKVNWKLGVDADLTPDILLYATASTGYRSGGLQSSSNPANFRQYAPETVMSYEGGIRANLFDRRLFLGLTAYQLDYDDLQVSSIIVDPIQGPIPVTTNAAKARIRGIELEGRFSPTRADHFSGYVSYLDGTFRSFPNGQDTLYSADTLYNIFGPILGYTAIPSATADFTGNELPNAPKWSARLSYAHDFDLGGGMLTPSVDFYVQSRTFADIGNYAQSRNPSYTKTDLNLTYAFADSNVTLVAFVNNLEDKRIPQNVTSVWSSTVVNYSAPRTIGARIGLHF